MYINFQNVQLTKLNLPLSMKKWWCNLNLGSTYIPIGISQQVAMGKSDDDKNRFTVTVFNYFRVLSEKTRCC